MAAIRHVAGDLRRREKFPKQQDAHISRTEALKTRSGRPPPDRLPWGPLRLPCLSLGAVHPNGQHFLEIGRDQCAPFRLGKETHIGAGFQTRKVTHGEACVVVVLKLPVDYPMSVSVALTDARSFLRGIPAQEDRDDNRYGAEHRSRNGKANDDQRRRTTREQHDLDDEPSRVG
jgi:hypothetical protein